MRRLVIADGVGPDLLARIMKTENASFSVPWTAEDFLSLAPPHFLALSLSEDGGLCGYGCFAVAGDQAEITNLAVDPAKRRLGIGAELLGFMISAARGRGAATCFLEVRESNSAARALYTSRGFRTVGKRPLYYRLPREDALVMALEL